MESRLWEQHACVVSLRVPYRSRNQTSQIKPGTLWICNHSVTQGIIDDSVMLLRNECHYSRMSLPFPIPPSFLLSSNRLLCRYITLHSRVNMCGLNVVAVLILIDDGEMILPVTFAWVLLLTRLIVSVDPPSIR